MNSLPVGGQAVVTSAYCNAAGQLQQLNWDGWTKDRWYGSGQLRKGASDIRQSGAEVAGTAPAKPAEGDAAHFPCLEQPPPGRPTRFAPPSVPTSAAPLASYVQRQEAPFANDVGIEARSALGGHPLPQNLVDPAQMSFAL